MTIAGRLIIFLSLALSSGAMGVVNVEHGVIFKSNTEFAGWPANEGIWSWGDEILVGFQVGEYKKRTQGHSVVLSAPTHIAFARSTDGGRSWRLEDHPQIATIEDLEDPKLYRERHPDLPQPVDGLGDFDFASPDFILKLRGPVFYTSKDKGHTWGGPYRIPAFGVRPIARTNYIPTGPKSCLVFLSSQKKGVVGVHSYVLETTDGGKTFQFLSWITDGGFEKLLAGAKEGDRIHSTMPTAVMLDDGRIVCATRHRLQEKTWIDVLESTDHARTWSKCARIADGPHNPAQLVKLESNRLAIVYGRRNDAPNTVGEASGTPSGICAKVSDDGGRTWSGEVTLRQDALSWDMGYPRAVLRPDGAIVVVYYYATAVEPVQHIAVSVWTPAPPVTP